MMYSQVVLLLEKMYLAEGTALARPLVDKQLCALLEAHIMRYLSEHTRSQATKAVMGESEQEYMQLGALLVYEGKMRVMMEEATTAGDLDESWWCERFIEGLRPAELRKYVKEKVKDKLKDREATIADASRWASEEV